MMLEPDFKRRYHQQKDNARKRGIEWGFTFSEWRDWWLTNDRCLRRGNSHRHLCMARKGDTGPYSPENVYLATKMENSNRSTPKDEPMSLADELRGWRKRKRWNREEAAEHLCVSPRTLEGWESGRSCPYPRILRLAMLAVDLQQRERSERETTRLLREIMEP